MALYIYSIDEAVDRKYVVTKTVSGQAKAGTLVHIMDCEDKGDGNVTVSYRVTETGQDFTMDFSGTKQFCKWALPDNFIARHYENLSQKDILYYLKVKSRSFVSFYLPIMIVAIVIIWAISLLAIKSVMVGVIVGAVLSVAVALGVVFYYKYQKKHVDMDIYSKVSSNSWGVVIK